MSDENEQKIYPSVDTVEDPFPDELSFPCDQCEETFHTSKELMVHVRKAENHEAICKACDKTFTNFDNMRIHKRKYHYEPSEYVGFVCDSCGKACKTRDLLREHWNFVHKIEIGLNCNLCGRSCQNMLKLRRHMKMCLTRDSQLGGPKSHLLDPGSDSSQTCSTSTNMKTVLNIAEEPISTNGYKKEEPALSISDNVKPEDKHVTNVKPEDYSFCDQFDFDVSHLAEQNLKGDDNNYEDVGSGKMNEVTDLIKVEVDPDIEESVIPLKKKRIRIRNQKGIHVEPKVCPICAKVVKYLSGHIKDVHTETPGERHICTECGKVFTKAKKLRGHFDAVHKDEPTMCDICSQVFKNVHALRGHKRKVHEDMDGVNCPSCFKTFANKTKLYEHGRAVHTLEDSKCHACDKTYKNKNLLQKHFKVMHKDLYEEEKVSKD